MRMRDWRAVVMLRIISNVLAKTETAMLAHLCLDSRDFALVSQGARRVRVMLASAR